MNKLFAACSAHYGVYTVIMKWLEVPSDPIERRNQSTFRKLARALILGRVTDNPRDEAVDTLMKHGFEGTEVLSSPESPYPRSYRRQSEPFYIPQPITHDTSDEL